METNQLARLRAVPHPAAPASSSTPGASLDRLVRFWFAAAEGPGDLTVFTEAPPVPTAHELDRLPVWCQSRHVQLLGAHLDGLAQLHTVPASPTDLAARLDHLSRPRPGRPNRADPPPMTLTARSPVARSAASRSNRRPAINVVPTHPSSGHTLAGSPHGEPAALTHRLTESTRRFTITALGSAGGGTVERVVRTVPHQHAALHRGGTHDNDNDNDTGAGRAAQPDGGEPLPRGANRHAGELALPRPRTGVPARRSPRPLPP